MKAIRMPRVRIQERSVPVDVMRTGTECSNEKAKESFRYDPSRFWSERSDGQNKKQDLL